MTGVPEPRRRFTLSGREVFRLKSSEELRSAERGDSPRPAAGQEGRHQGFYPLNSHFLLGGSGADCRPVTAAKRGTAVGLPQRGFRKIFAVHRQRTATHTVNSTQSAAQQCRAIFLRVVTEGTCEFRRLVDLSSQVLSIITCSRIARHCYPPGDLLLPFGQFTLCRACVN